MDEKGQLYEIFVKDDLAKNHGLIYNQYEEMKAIMRDPKGCSGIVSMYLYNMLDFAVSNSMFYQKYAGWKSLQDFPVINKHFLKEHYDDIKVESYAKKKGSCIKSTSGSTGMPFSIVMDHRKHCRYIADLKWYALQAGCDSHERMIYMHNAHHAFIKDMEVQRRDNFYNLSYTYCDEENIVRLLDEIEELEPYGLMGYTSIYNAMANYIIEKNPPRRNFHLKFVVSTSESLTKRTVDALEAYFGCPVYDRYGSEETSVLAQEDGSKYGYRFNEGSYHLEILALNEDREVECGETGRIVITDMFNCAYPLIRYDTGDLGIKVVSDEGGVYLKKIWGRALDSIYTTDGRLVPGGEATDFLESIMDIRQFQLIQETEKDYHWLVNSLNHSYDEHIISETKKMLGTDANVFVEYVDEVPCMKSGKRLKTVCNIKKE